MKSPLRLIRLWLLVILLSGPPVLAQDSTEIRDKRALFIVHNGDGFENFGFKYRISKFLMPYVTFMFSIEDRESETLNDSPMDTKTISFGLGLQVMVITHARSSFYVAAATEYSFWTNKIASSPSGYGRVESESSTKEIAFDLGPGVEIGIFRWLSFSGQHLFRASHQTFREKRPWSREEWQNDKSKLQLGRTTLVFSFYF